MQNTTIGPKPETLLANRSTMNALAGLLDADVTDPGFRAWVASASRAGYLDHCRSTGSMAVMALFWRAYARPETARDSLAQAHYLIELGVPL
jgi:hypothetical protein